MTLPTPLYSTNLGSAYCGDSMDLLKDVEKESVQLVITSPPFALQRPKEYGNHDQESYVDWLLAFAPLVKEALREDGSFVLDLGGAYQRGKPIRSLYNYRVLLRMCDELGWNLAEEFFWYNPSRLPSPIEWVNKKKLRTKDAVNTVWWFSKSDHPKADVTKVLAPYSERMKLLLKNSSKYYTPKKRPSGHDISDRFGIDKGGAIPPNLLEFEEHESPTNLLKIPNTESNSRYLQGCRLVGAEPHPARFPEGLPEFFIKFLTEKGDAVMDVFAGSNTTGAVAERLGRRWIAFEIDREYLVCSAFRFLSEVKEQAATVLYERLRSGTGGLTSLLPSQA